MGRKDYEGKCRRDGVSVEDTNKFFSMEDTSSTVHRYIVPGPAIHFVHIRIQVRQWSKNPFPNPQLAPDPSELGTGFRNLLVCSLQPHRAPMLGLPPL